MDEAQQALEDRMTPEERELVERHRKVIGVETAPVSPHAIWDNDYRGEPVSAYKVERWAHLNSDYNALYCDPEFAKESCWGGVIASPMYVMALDDGVWPVARISGDMYEPGTDCIVRHAAYPTFRGAMMASSDFEFFEPIRPGDSISVTGKTTDLFWKQGSRYRLLFAKGDIIFRDQHGRVVALDHTGAVFMFK
jgi:acyl dehydratase